MAKKLLLQGNLKRLLVSFNVLAQKLRIHWDLDIMGEMYQ